MTYDVAPGGRRRPGFTGGRDAPLQKIVSADLAPRYAISELTGHPGDQGTNIRLIAPEVNGSTDLVVGLFSQEPNQYHPCHFHPESAEFYYVLEGSCLVTVDDQDVEARAGMMFYFPRGTVHAVRTRDGERVATIFGFDRPDGGTTWLE